jgi:glycerol-3-phosphate dehydrogenase subunit B
MGARKVVVIGSGLAGISAAAFAKKAGALPLVISKGHAATAFCSGALDICGDPCLPAPAPADVSADVAQNISSLLTRQPLHPYNLLAGGPDSPVDAVLSLVRDARDLLFPSNGLIQLSGGLEKNRACFTALGTIKWSALFPTRTAGPDAEGMERPAALGIEGFSDFEPGMWARVAGEVAARLGHNVDALAGMIGFGRGHDKQSPFVAIEIAKDPEAFIEAIKDAMSGVDNASSVILPPVLPAGGRDDLIRKITDALSLPVYELLSLPPSAPGLRLAEHLDGVAKELGADLVRAEVVGYESEGDILKALLINEHGAGTRVEAEAFVLASGKFLGGGIEKDRAFKELIFDLPVFIGDSAPGEIFIEKVAGLHVNERHAMFEAGLKIDEALRPLGQDNKPRFNNLFAAGAIIQGYNYMTDGTGAGVALATGAKAGTNATKTF